MDTSRQIQQELEHAEQARQRGNEGQARVCARRAAGMAARDYLNRHGQAVRTPSAYDLLRLLVDDPGIPPDIHQAAAYLTLRVDEEFKLPAGVDLILEARNLCEKLKTM